MGYVKWEKYTLALIGLVAIFAAPTCRGITDPRDVSAINYLYSALEFPPLTGWLVAGGDPCAESWQGVQCVLSNITAIILNGTNLGGELGVNLGLFPSIIEINLSNNHIGGTISSTLPVTLRSLILSTNQLSGSIPEIISSLTELTDLSLSNNRLTGAIPDSFQQLAGLQSLKLSNNKLSGQLPPSMGSLSALATMHLQDNRLIGTLNVLEDLPNLVDLNIEDNLFSGPIPPKLLSIPNFRRAGNPFNTSIIIVPPPALPPSIDSSGALPPEGASPWNHASPQEITYPAQGKKSNGIKIVLGVAIAGLVIVLVVLVLWLVFCKSRCYKKRPSAIEISKRKRNEMNASSSPEMNTNRNASTLKPFISSENVPRKESVRSLSSSKGKDKQQSLLVVDPVSKQNNDHQIGLKPSGPPCTLSHHTAKDMISARPFTIASLQQYTNSFSQENLIGRGLIGTVYRASFPNGKVLAIKNLHDASSRQWSDEDFLKLVSNVSILQHENIVELVGYCSEHGQRLLAYGYCRNGTLHEALHLNDEIHEKLSWNARVHIALQAARALEYLHEACHPPIEHGNFKSANVLLDDELSARVSDCGLAPLISPDNIAQVLRSGYGAPELELGSYNYRSDVYSFGVVMLELLTGRKAYDRMRPRAEQNLVKWAMPQVHDINLLSRMVDPSLKGTYPFKSLSRFADIISLCIQLGPEFRPPMSEIVENLLHMID